MHHRLLPVAPLAALVALVGLVCLVGPAFGGWLGAPLSLVVVGCGSGCGIAADNGGRGREYLVQWDLRGEIARGSQDLT